MRLDPGGLVPIRRGRFDHIRVDRALHQELRPSEPAGLAFKDANEFLANNPALLLRIGDTLEGFEKFLGSIHNHQFSAHLLAEGTDHLFRFALPQETGIHEYSHLLVADGFMHQRGRHRRVHAAAYSSQDAFPSNLALDPGDTLLDDRPGCPIRITAANIGGKMTQDLRSVRGVIHLGVELHGKVPALKITDRCEGAAV